jgi:hypothetical protein
MMYVVFIINHIHHLMNESKMWFFAYNSDRRVYVGGQILSPFSRIILLFDIELCGLEIVVNACCRCCRELMARDPILC